MKDQNRKLSPKLTLPNNKSNKPKDFSNRNTNTRSRSRIRPLKTERSQTLDQKTFKKKPAIKEIVREPTSGGIVFRFNEKKNDIEILLIQDSKNRWTIPKGHIETGCPGSARYILSIAVLISLSL